MWNGGFNKEIGYRASFSLKIIFSPQMSFVRMSICCHFERSFHLWQAQYGETFLKMIKMQLNVGSGIKDYVLFV